MSIPVNVQIGLVTVSLEVNETTGRVESCSYSNPYPTLFNFQLRDDDLGATYSYQLLPGAVDTEIPEITYLTGTNVWGRILPASA